VTRAADALAALVLDLPMVKLTKSYTLTGPAGPASLPEIFDGRKQLVIYHFMFGPDTDQGCPHCSVFADHIPDLRHLHTRNTTFAVISRAPIDTIEAFKKRMGWNFPWYSSYGSDFNYDFHVTQDEAVAPIEYNFKTKEELQAKGYLHNMRGEQSGMSVFYQEDGEVFHTYSSYERGTEKFLGTCLMLDITPLGRQDPEDWSKGFTYHDKYE
jgi:predicted dithiol-disulfide oxidoreductase (DUF899 family)